MTIAVNWWFEMTFGRDWVYKELCHNLRSSLLEPKEETADFKEEIQL